MKSVASLALVMIVLVVSTTPGADGKADNKAPALAGTHWALLSLTGKGEKITDAQTPADVEFNKDGKWSILHYGGMLQGGTYKVKDGRLIMKSEDGTDYMEGKMNWKSEDKILELRDSSDFLMRLRLSKQK